MKKLKKSTKGVGTLLSSRERKKCENGARVEKKRLSKDLYYTRKQTTINFIYFIYKTNVKDI
jgi:hypothetical protein